MSADKVDAEQARAQLDQASLAGLDDGPARRVLAVQAAGVGLVVGGFVVADHQLQGVRFWSTLLNVAVVAALLGLVLSQTRGTRTTPRGATSAWWWGLGTSLSLTFAASWALNSSVLTIDRGPVFLTVVGVVVALPLLVAAAVIARGGRR